MNLRGRFARTSPQHRSIVVVDISGYGRFDNLAQLEARATLDALVRDSFRGVLRRRPVIEGTGDGVIALFPASMSKLDILDPLVPRLTTLLRAHNVRVDPFRRIRLRIAVHAGEILRDSSGWAGTDLNLACRLVDSEPAYRRLADFPASDVVVVVSDVIYQGVVQHGYRSIRPATYSPVRVVVKEVNTRAWVHLPDQTGVLSASRW